MAEIGYPELDLCSARPGQRSPLSAGKLLLEVGLVALDGILVAYRFHAYEFALIQQSKVC